MSTALLIALVFTVLGAVVYLVTNDKVAEVGRAFMWIGVLLLGLALTGLGLA